LSRVRFVKLLADALFIFLVDEGLNLVFLRRKPDAKKDFQVMSDRKVRYFPLEHLECGAFDVCDCTALQLQFGLLHEHLDLVFALVLLDVLGGQGQTGDGERLPVLLLLVLAREAQVHHHCRRVARARQQLDRLTQLEHPVDQHAALLQILELLFAVSHFEDAVERVPLFQLGPQFTRRLKVELIFKFEHLLLNTCWLKT
jgi:hypothetical protein